MTSDAGRVRRRSPTLYLALQRALVYHVGHKTADAGRMANLHFQLYKLIYIVQKIPGGIEKRIWQGGKNTEPMILKSFCLEANRRTNKGSQDRFFNGIQAFYERLEGESRSPFAAQIWMFSPTAGERPRDATTR